MTWARIANSSVMITLPYNASRNSHKSKIQNKSLSKQLVNLIKFVILYKFAILCRMSSDPEMFFVLLLVFSLTS